ncbi:aminotransferase class V-fold PLP-dependent enzyme [Streptomyces sp. 6N223]|uniref:aminotransferase class V-fold PLP-dependent enzyme n=1 Tax=Streptomyces sp. 6N223 TaxID=3457412 RepID=UPI003FD53D2C
MDSLCPSEFAPKAVHLNTASRGLLPARTVAALHAAVDDGATTGAFGADYFETAAAARAAFARIAGVEPARVAVGSAVSVHVALVAATLPAGAEVLVADGDFSSLVSPFAARGDLVLRGVPLEEIAGAVRPGTAMVAVSAVQSADGRIADLAALREAARAHGARTLVDATQAVGWLPLRAADYDYVVCGAYKWLLCPKGTSFLAVPEDFGDLRERYAGWAAAEDPWTDCYGPVRRYAATARRFDQAHAYLPYAGAAHSLALIEEIGTERIAEHDAALAERFRDGVRALGLAPVAAPGSAIVSVPDAGGLVDRLAAEGIGVASRGGNLRAAFHLYNTGDEVQRALEALARARG